MKERINQAILAAFSADALSLGVHWVYDTAQIKETYDRLDQMTDPVLAPYHKGKKAGDFTHYGDQMMVLLESVSANKGFSMEDFSRRWQALFSSYGGYIDHATKETQSSLADGKTPDNAGSDSTDLAGASRIPPLFLFYSGDENRLITDVRRQTAMTHNQPDVLDTAEWAFRAAVKVLAGENPIDAMAKAADETGPNGSLKKMVTQGIESKGAETAGAIQLFGQMCAVEAALPSAVHLVARYQDDFKNAMIENVMAGGDSSARGMLAAFLIGCGRSDRFIPGEWLTSMAAYKAINDLL